jgi:hypothetical protein
MKNVHKNLRLILLSLGLFFLVTFSGLGQGVTLQNYQTAGPSHQGVGHNEKCGHTFLEAQQEREQGVFGSKVFFEDWITKKIVEKNSKPQIMRVQAEPRVIPVVVHIIHNGTAIGVEANISDAQIREQIRVLNEDFRRLNADAIRTPVEFLPVAADANIEFILAKQDPSGLPTTGIVRKQGTQESYSPSDATQIGQLSQWNPAEYLNIWVVPLVSPYLGFATFPTSTLPGLNFAPSASIRDGVTVDYLFFGTGPGTAANTNGRTATHEVGHYLGLRHIWGDGGCEVDDFVLDTPNQDSPNNSICNANPTRFSCGSNDMIQNYMDYTPDPCMNLFTKGQVDRFDVVLANSPRRVTLVNNRATRDPLLSNRDVSLLKVINPSDALCQQIIAPQVEIQNRGNEFVSSVRIEFRWNGSLIESKRFDTELRTTETAVFTFGNLDTGGESNEFTFTVVQVNDQADLVPDNNTLSTRPVQQGQLTLPFNVSLTNLPPTWILRNEDQSFTWEKKELTLDGVATPSLFIRHYEYEAQGQLDYFISPQIDLSKNPNVQLVFEVAHAPYNEPGFQDDLLVAIAPDCSPDFDILTPPYKKSGTRLQTSGPTVEEFIPTSNNQFRTELVNLSKFKDLGKIRIAIITKNAFGNNIYLKNIRILPTEEFKYNLRIDEVVAPSPISGGNHAQEIVKISNTGNLPVTRFLFSRNTNNAGNQVFLANTPPIQPGQSLNVTLSNSTRDGKNNLRFVISDPNFDQNQDTAPVINWYGLENTGRLEVPWRQNFNASTEINPWLSINPESDLNAWQTSSVSSTTGPNNVARVEGGTNGNSYWMSTPIFDLSTSRQASVFFDVAAGAQNNPATTLYLLASANEGETYKVVWSAAGIDLATVSAGGANPGTASDYERKYVNLTEFAGAGNKNIRLAFVLDVVGTQNSAVFLDNIELFLSANPEPVIPAERNTIIYPNPASEFVNVAFNLPKRENVTIQIISSTGALVRELSFPNTLNQTYTFSREMFTPGLYLFKINSSSLQEIKRVLIN